jgi:hypothetical protein
MPSGDVVQMPDVMTPWQKNAFQNIVNKQLGLKQPGMPMPAPTPGELLTNKAYSLAPTAAETARVASAGPLQKAIMNINAGASDVYQGARQMIPGVQGETADEAIQRQNYNQMVAKSMPGGGAIQTGEKIAATLPLAFLPGLGGAAVGGAAMGALDPTQDPVQRAKNMLLGGGLGAALSKAVPYLGETTTSFTPARNVGAAALKEVGPGQADAVIQALRNAPEKTSVGTTPTAFQVTGNAGLATLESQSRKARPAVWNDHDATNDVARVDNFNSIVGDDPKTALENANKDFRDSVGAASTKAVNEVDAQTKANYPNYGIGSALKNSGIPTMAKVGNDAGQNVLDEIHAGINAGPVDAATAARWREGLSTAGEADPAIRAAKDSIDQVMHERSGLPGQDSAWNQYLQTATEKGLARDQAQAMYNIKASHIDPESGVTLGPSATTQIDGAKLADALRQNMTSPTYGTQIVPPEKVDAITDLANEERSSNAWQTAPGPNTNTVGGVIKSYAQPLAYGAVTGALAHGMGPVGAFTGAAAGLGAKLLGDVSDAWSQDTLAKMLRDPKSLADAMESAQNVKFAMPPLAGALRTGVANANPASWLPSPPVPSGNIAPGGSLGPAGFSSDVQPPT